MKNEEGPDELSKASCYVTDANGTDLGYYYQVFVRTVPRRGLFASDESL